MKGNTNTTDLRVAELEEAIDKILKCAVVSKDSGSVATGNNSFSIAYTPPADATEVIAIMPVSCVPNTSWGAITSIMVQSATLSNTTVSYRESGNSTAQTFHGTVAMIYK